LDALRRYIIREQVKITDVTDLWRCFALVGPEAAVLVERVLETRAPAELYEWTWGHVGAAAARVVRSARARVPSYDIVTPLAAAADLQAALKDVPELPDDV